MWEKIVANDSLSLEGRGCRVRVMLCCFIVMYCFHPHLRLPPQGGGSASGTCNGEECRLSPSRGRNKREGYSVKRVPLLRVEKLAVGVDNRGGFSYLCCISDNFLGV